MRSLVLFSSCLVAGAAALSIATSSSRAGTFGPGEITIETSRPLLEHTVNGGEKGLIDNLGWTPPRRVGTSSGVGTSAASFVTAYAGAGRYAGTNNGVDFFELPNEATKSYYYHASEDAHSTSIAGANAFVEIKPRTHYKVLFIKAPSASASAIARVRAAARTRTQEKTIVYVLAKDADAEAEALADAAVDTYQSASPEVRFVKYRGDEASAIAIAKARAHAHADSEAVSSAGAGVGGRIINSPRFVYNGEEAGGIGTGGSFSTASSSAGVQNGGGAGSFLRSYHQSGGVSFGASPTFVKQY